ncbi:alpha/beta hydrolase [Microbacterium sp. cx-55]|uniref:alpha/beta fold hydrolase n=1 Tax=Microbacterium sp. cx-55 TaxID=2875948 RepID=UPI001CC1501E|nr:alpha/beta hydrolase [Microbacterium sp. cx-55]MBZ4487870.1 alpha/beta hydrolase [Microbacterium sp. cx-55]UGB34719.1 alpha/beta hydrolase [Microbacterium sp. cx-55]
MQPARVVDPQGREFRVFSSRGAPGAPVYVLVHGIGMSHRSLEGLHAALAAHATVHTIDLPGFGGVPRPAGELDVPTMAAALGRVIDGLGAQRIVAVGHSMGAQWVTELGVQRPDLVSRVVVIGPAADVRHRTALAQGLALAVDSTRERPATNAIVVADYIRCGLPWFVTQLRAMLAYPLEERTAVLRMPLLVIRGGWDPVAGRRWSREVRDSARDAHLVEIPRRPHYAQHSAPRAVASAIRTFADADAAIGPDAALPPVPR